jgi:hypothetical protein
VGTIIVVEGPDGAGKTTLINKLVEMTGLPVAPRVVSKDAEAMVDLQAWVEDNVTQGFQPVIFDRHRLFSEPIYGPILRESFEPGFDNLCWFNEMLTKFYECKPVMIYCLPPFETVRRNTQADPDNRVVQDHHTIKQVWSMYFNKVMTDHVLYGDAWIYDYTHPTDIIGLLVAHINHRVQELSNV